MPTLLEEVVVPSRVVPGGLDDPLYEIINGQQVELPPISVLAVWIANQLVAEIAFFTRTHDLGRPVVEMLFSLAGSTDKNRRPDAAFVSYDRWAKDRPLPMKGNAWEVVPDVAVEVVSPSDLAEELMQKLIEYFQTGVRLVWVVYPGQQMVYVYESLTQVRGLTRNDELDGGTVLPGFRLPLVSLFADAPPQV